MPTIPTRPPLPVVSERPLGDLGVILHNTLVLYGPTGTRKTVSIGDFAKYIYEKTGKKTRLLTADGGGWGPIQDVVKCGDYRALAGGGGGEAQAGYYEGQQVVCGPRR